MVAINCGFCVVHFEWFQKVLISHFNITRHLHNMVWMDLTIGKVAHLPQTPEGCIVFRFLDFYVLVYWFLGFKVSWLLGCKLSDFQSFKV